MVEWDGGEVVDFSVGLSEGMVCVVCGACEGWYVGGGCVVICGGVY